MTGKTLLAILCCSVGLSGCDRLSEKEKMEMIAKCDLEARKKLVEKDEFTKEGYLKVTITTHYSFGDQRCYALEETQLTPSLWFRERFSFAKDQNIKTLYDGLTKKQLIYVSTDGVVIGEGVSPDADVAQVEKLIEAYMNKP